MDGQARALIESSFCEVGQCNVDMVSKVCNHRLAVQRGGRSASLEWSVKTAECDH